MPTIERAAAHFPGFGVKLWMVLQDLAQLQWQYRNSWQTMIGNAGLVQFFATLNLVTNDDILGAPRHELSREVHPGWAQEPHQHQHLATRA
jgi:hypothetical protein